MIAQLNGTTIAFDVLGSGLAFDGGVVREKPVLFVLHGGPGLDHTYFRPWLDDLAEVAQLVFVDHRGTGRSGRPPIETCTIEQMADDLDALRRHLGLERVALLGHSFGGMLALTTAIRHPESIAKLLLVATTASYDFMGPAGATIERVGTPEQLARMPELFEGTIRDEAQFADWWQVMLPVYFREYDPAMGEATVKRGRWNPLVAAKMFSEDIPAYDVRPSLPRLRMPTLVTAGRHDWVLPPVESEAIAAGIPGSRLTVYERSGHFPFIEEHDPFIAEASAFLAEG